MQFRKVLLNASIIFSISAAMAEPKPETVDLSKLYEQFEKSSYSSLELIETTKRGSWRSRQLARIGETERVGRVTSDI